MSEVYTPSKLVTELTRTTSIDPSRLGGNVPVRPPTPEELEAYSRLQAVIEEQLRRPETTRHNGIEALGLRLPDEYEGEYQPLISITKKRGSSIEEIPRDVPMSDWGDYISDITDLGKKAEPNFHISLYESESKRRAEYILNPDGSVSRTLFDSFAKGNVLDFIPLAPVSEVNLLTQTLPECVPSSTPSSMEASGTSSPPPSLA